MVSAMISREFGFGTEIVEGQLLEVNKSREGAKYKDKEAATHLNGISDKKYLAYGSGKDGYRTYRHLIIQIEDCIDCIKMMYPQFNYELELDHLSGHSAEHNNGL